MRRAVDYSLYHLLEYNFFLVLALIRKTMNLFVRVLKDTRRKHGGHGAAGTQPQIEDQPVCIRLDISVHYTHTHICMDLCIRVQEFYS